MTTFTQDNTLNGTVIMCPLSTHFFHSSTKGCSLFLNDQTHDLWHRYHGTLVSSLLSGEPLILALTDNKLNKFMDFTYRIKYPLNSNQAVLETGPLNKHVVEQLKMPVDNSIKQYFSLNQLLEITDVIDLLHFSIREYIVQCSYASKFFNKSIFLNVKNFFDIIIIIDNNIGHNKLCWLRPCFWTENIIEISKDFLTAILKLYEMKIEDHKKISINHNSLSNLQSQTKKKRLNVSQCNMKTFLNRIPQHLKCSKTTNSVNTLNGQKDTQENVRFFKCQHFNLCDINLDTIEEHTIVNISLPSNFFKNSCNNVLKFLQNKFSIETISKIYGFSCRLNKHIKNEIDREYQRMELLHPIVCCPDTLINNMYLESLFDLFLTDKNTLSNNNNISDKLWKKQLYSLLLNKFN